MHFCPKSRNNTFTKKKKNYFKAECVKRGIKKISDDSKSERGHFHSKRIRK